MTRSEHGFAQPWRTLSVAILLAITAACSSDGTSIVSPVKLTPDTLTTASAPTQQPSTPTPPASSNFLTGATFWADPSSSARTTATAWRTSRPADAAQMDKIASQGIAKWIGNWTTNVQAEVNAATTTILGTGAVPVFVAYNIPQRDCGGLSGGNTTTVQAYRDWISAFANGIAGRKAVVILEPDALAAMDCLSPADQQVRLELLRFAVQTFTSKGSVAVYLDAGNPHWKSAATMSQRLVSAGVSLAQGFSLNVSNFVATNDNIAYGTQVSALVNGKHFIIDTGRNGLGQTADAQWCNPAGRALGIRPTSSTGNALVDAFLWIKTPGESDGACNGNPASGQWMPEYALGLAQRG